MAQEWTYRFLAASLQEAIEESGGQDRVADLATAKPPSMADVRAWAVAAGYAVAPRGRIAAEVIAAHERRNQ
ncbi:MAG: histone-like nucleoid-structuring protein Lsr2 [Ornithinimicrobium sp.]